MKLKTLAAVLPALCVIFSCQKPEIASVLTIDPEEASANCLADQTVTVTVTSTEAWTVTPDEEYSWVEVTPTSGKGNAEVTFKTIEKNTNSKNRTATFTFSNGAADDVEFSFRQLKYDADIDTPDEPEPDPEAPSITLSETSGAFTAEGGSKDITVNATNEWTLASGADWLTATPESGKDGDVVTITVAENTDTELRTAEITFTMGDSTAVFTASQEGCEPVPATPLSLKSGDPDVMVGHHDGDSKISGATFVWEIEDNGQAFAATLTPNEGATLNVDAANHKITLTVPEAEIKDTTYTWEINANVANPGEVEPLILVARQQCYSNKLDNTPQMGLRVYAKEIKSEDDLTSGVYRITNYSSGWLFCHMFNKHDQTAKFAYNGYWDNDLDYTNGKIIEGLDGGNGMIYAVRADGLFKFTSTGEKNTFYVRPVGAPDLGLGVSDAGELIINYANRNAKWNMEYKDYGWVLSCNGCSINPTNGSMDSSNLQTPYEISESAYSPSANKHLKLFKETRKVDDMIKVDTKTKDMTAAEGTVELTVTANKNWTATSDSNWATIDPSTGTPGQTKVTVSIAANTSDDARTAVVTFTAGDATATFTVNQAGVEHKITLSKTSADFVAAGGSEEISVESTEDWTVSSDSDWLTATPESGSNGDKVTVTAAANTTTSARTGVVTFTMGSKTATFTASQLGTKSPLTLKSGKKEVIVGYHNNNGTTQDETQDTDVKGATFEWEIEDNNQEFTATVTPTNGATLNVDAANHKISLTIPAAEISNTTYTWEIKANVKDADDLEPLILVARQQCYSNWLDGGDKQDLRVLAQEIKSTDDLVAGTYRIINYASGWKYFHMMNYQADAVKFAHNTYCDNYNDYLGGNIKEGLDGNNGMVYAVLSEGLFDITPASEGKYYIRPVGVTNVGLGNINGSVGVSYSCRNSEWSFEFISYGWALSCDGYYMSAGSSMSTSGSELQTGVSFSTSKPSYSSSRTYIKIYKVL